MQDFFSRIIAGVGGCVVAYFLCDGLGTLLLRRYPSFSFAPGAPVAVTGLLVLLLGFCGVMLLYLFGSLLLWKDLP